MKYIVTDGQLETMERTAFQAGVCANSSPAEIRPEDVEQSLKNRVNAAVDCRRIEYREQPIDQGEKAVINYREELEKALVIESDEDNHPSARKAAAVQIRSLVPYVLGQLDVYEKIVFPEGKAFHTPIQPTKGYDWSPIGTYAGPQDDDTEYLLVWGRITGDTEHHMYEVRCYRGQFWWNLKDIVENVTHWMPLPKGPNE